MKRDPQALQDREHDVLVIGGGIAGAWVVWEAASRGLSAALVELEDFGQATSWSSLKTAHGGLRHLQRLDVAGFRESVRERRALLRVAPEVVRPLSFAIAATGLVDRAKFFMGGLLNDVLSFDRNHGLRPDRNLGASRWLSSAEASARCGPAFAGSPAFVWQDAQITHTERLLMALLHAASAARAVIVNRCRLLSCEPAPGGFALRAVDEPGGQDLTIRARSIVNASGAQLENVARLFGGTCGSPPLIRGVNVVLRDDLSPGVAIGARDGERFLFLAPWLGRSILGTVYDDGGPPVDQLVRQLMEGGRRAFPWADLADSEIAAVHSGHVPGAPNGEPIYRSRVIGHADPRILSILTAKYTTARATAEKVIDRLGATLNGKIAPSVSAGRALPMAKPLAGSLALRLRVAQEEEMALSVEDALRGRLIEGAFGDVIANLDRESDKIPSSPSDL
ncbi:MAG: FAD-dependent oxidoreductase [Vicinamibacteria bacterium]|nr:FAD-dependent oxidoreductase [Vicinamibacteria bacterium]